MQCTKDHSKWWMRCIIIRSQCTFLRQFLKKYSVIFLLFYWKLSTLNIKASLICSFQNFRFRWEFTNFLGTPEDKCLAEEFSSVFIVYNEVYGLKEDRMTLVLSLDHFIDISSYLGTELDTVWQKKMRKAISVGSSCMLYAGRKKV